jgi:hypothetical protein
MASPAIPAGFIPTQPKLADTLNLLKRKIMLELCCHHIGVVQSFNATKQTAQVTISYPKTYFVLNTTTQQYVANQVSYPILLDCPVIFLGGGTSSLTFPVVQGDQCLVLFNDRDLGNWLAGGTGAACATARTHSFSDGIILVGLRSNDKAIASFDTANAVLQMGAVAVKVGTKITLKNNSTTLNTVLQNILTQLQNLTSALSALTVLPGTFTNAGGAVTGVSGIPVNAATITAVGTQLSTLATTLGGLLG